MTRKKMLNLTSTKKRDTMSNYTNLTTSVDGGTTFYSDNTILNGGRLYGFVWCPTARTGASGGDAAPKGSAIDASTRTSTTCYMRGLKERIQIQTSSGVAWQWRRICFTTKDPTFDALQQTDAKLYVYTSAGYSRVTNDWWNKPTLQNFVEGRVFKGQKGIDWTNYFSAPLDSSRITIKSDTTRIMQSGNTNGILKNYNMWHPMNKNLVYDDDEVGGVETTGNMSTKGKAGMGDYMILDLIGSGTGGTSADKLSWAPTASLYWHEK